jgi:2,4-dienoyl-CoA reductase-like NADH-dependent reductase (Old Yellow Enzyme family)
MYSSEDGFANDWHLVHLGTRAIGGAGLVITEAIAVEARGRISPSDLGIWKDEHIEFLSRITAFIKAHGAVPGTQLAHAGRKASVARPWDGIRVAGENEGGWTPISPDNLPYEGLHPTPHALSREEIGEVVAAFGAAARRAKEAGFQVIELHGAHGYLLHEFLSPISNQRTDEYGGSAENRARIVLEVVEAVRNEWPAEYPLFMRVSATDWLPEATESWRLENTIALAKILKEQGVDLIDASSGGNSPAQQLKVIPGYQVPFAEAIRQESGLLTAAVGLITEAKQADAIIHNGQADMIALARVLLRDPYWPLNAAKELGQEVKWPNQYLRGRI